MPHATTGTTATTTTTTLRDRSPAVQVPGAAKPLSLPMNGTMGSHDEGLEKFPELDPHILARSPSPQKAAGANGLPPHPPPPPGQRLPRTERTTSIRWQSPSGLSNSLAYEHHRQKSLGEALRTIRTRSASTSQNVHEIADALKAPISPTLIMLCVMWYSSSALTNTSSKSILNAFARPATLTLVQFFFVSFYCITLAWLASIYPSLRQSIPALKHGIRYPSAEVIRTTLPLAAFQIGGHLLSSTATSKIPVSLVHTIKGLSPLFTVVAYRLCYDIRYPTTTYLSLIPLTLGVMLACSGSHSFSGGQFLGILYALLATVIFVTQNIFSKRLFNEASRAEAEGLSPQARKLDKLNLLCYSSGLAFIITVPIWFWSEGAGILGDFLWDGSVDLSERPGAFDHGRLFIEFVFNGTFHFAQNILAFVLLSMVSPVTYSVASLIKRVFVIAIAIIWFRSPTTKIQAVGIMLTFLGLYFYDRTNENKADRRARTLTDAKGEAPLLPLNASSVTAVATSSAAAPVVLNGNANGSAAIFDSPVSTSPHPYTTGYGLPNTEDIKKSDDAGRGGGRARGASNAVTWMPPGTRQQDTWRAGDVQIPAS